MQAEPSPPFRFTEFGSFAERLTEIAALARPHVVEVGRIHLPERAAESGFTDGDLIEFTVTVGCTPGVTDHEDLVCGIQLTAADASGHRRIPVEQAQLAVQVHPSGRLRYKLGLPGVGSGHYHLGVAFAVRDSGDAPLTATLEFDVHEPNVRRSTHSSPSWHGEDTLWTEAIGAASPEPPSTDATAEVDEPLKDPSSLPDLDDERPITDEGVPMSSNGWASGQSPPGPGPASPTPWRPTTMTQNPSTNIGPWRRIPVRCRRTPTWRVRLEGSQQVVTWPHRIRGPGSPATKRRSRRQGIVNSKTQDTPRRRPRRG